MRLLTRIDEVPVAQLAVLFSDLAEGENGFGGTPVHTQGVRVEDHVLSCIAGEAEEGLAPGRVPESHFVVCEGGEAAGLFRIRHRLNAALERHGGHVGYYIRPAYRRRGLARRALLEALEFLRELGEPRALITVDDGNVASIGVIEACGGALADKLLLEEHGILARRYWVEL